MAEDVWEDKFGRRHIPRGDREAVLERVLTTQLDYKQLIMFQIRNCQIAISYYGENAFSRTVATLLAMIPEKERDDAFREVVADAIKGKTAILMGERKTGRYTVSRRPITVKVIVPNWALIFHECINLFRRRGMLWSESRQEIF